MSIRPLIIACAISVGAVAVPTASASASVVMTSGPFAFATFLTTERDPCVVATLAVDAIRTKEIAAPESSTRARMSLYVARYDTCRNEYLFIAHKEVPLSLDAIRGDGQELSLRADVLLEDPDGRGTLPVHVDLTWMATELLGEARAREAFRWTDVLVGRYLDEQWLAAISGTATSGETNYAAGEVLTAVMGEQRVAVNSVARSTSLASLLAASVATGGRSADGNGGVELSSRFAGAMWERWDERGCIRESAVVSAEDRDDASPFPIDSFAFVDVASYDYCQSRFLRGASAFVPLPRGFLDVAENLSSARISGTVEAVDYVTSEVVPLRVEIALEEVDVARRNWSGRFATDDALVVETLAETLHAATALGSIDDGTTDYLAGLSGHSTFAGFGTFRYHVTTRWR
jgi:hypothetical protein